MNLYPYDAVVKFLSPHLQGFSPDGTDNTICYCPFHDDAIGGKPSFSLQLRRGVFKCFSSNCGITGNLNKFCQIKNIPIPGFISKSEKNYEMVYSKLLENPIGLSAQYLFRRGIEESYITEMISNKEFAYEETDDSCFLVFPIYFPVKYEDRYYITGLQKINIYTNEKKVIGNLKNSVWFNNRYVTENVILVESILNAVSLGMFDISSVSIISCENKPDPMFIDSIQDVTLFLDNDSAGRNGSLEIYEKYNKCKTVTWVDTSNKKGMDVNDLIRIYPNAKETIIDMINSAEKPNKVKTLSNSLKSLQKLRIK